MTKFMERERTELGRLTGKLKGSLLVRLAPGLSVVRQQQLIICLSVAACRKNSRPSSVSTTYRGLPNLLMRICNVPES